jgi:hypothetical protein
MNTVVENSTTTIRISNDQTIMTVYSVETDTFHVGYTVNPRELGPSTSILMIFQPFRWV